MTGTPALQKTLNLAHTMRAIRRVPGCSRTDVAAATGLTKSTVSNMVRELSARGLVVEAPATTTGATGRPPIGLRLAPQLGILGIELRPRVVAITRLALDGRVTSKRRIDVAGGRSRTALAEVWRMCVAALTPAELAESIAVGVAVPAIVDAHEGVVLESEEFALTGARFRSIAREDTVIPVLLENDANAVAWAALGGAFGDAARTADDTTTAAPNLLVLTGRIDSESILRVGAAVVIDGRIHYGHRFDAGEIRSARWRRGSTVELAVTESDRGDRHAELRELLNLIAVAISLVRPDAVLLAGDLAGIRGHIDEIVSGEMAGSLADPLVSGVPLITVSEAEAAVAMGAAHMVLHHLFEIPSAHRTRPEHLPDWESIGR